MENCSESHYKYSNSEEFSFIISFAALIIKVPLSRKIQVTYNYKSIKVIVTVVNISKLQVFTLEIKVRKVGLICRGGKRERVSQRKTPINP